jgi:hypothetical protein
MKIVIIGVPVNLFAADSGNQVELYRLINEFRLKPHTCVGKETSSLPELKENRLLERAAGKRATGLPLYEALYQVRFSTPYAKVLVVGGANIKHVFDQIIQRHCTELADSKFTEIGASFINNHWWIILAYQIINDDVNTAQISTNILSQKHKG